MRVTKLKIETLVRRGILLTAALSVLFVHEIFLQPTEAQAPKQNGGAGGGFFEDAWDGGQTGSQGGLSEPSKVEQDSAPLNPAPQNQAQQNPAPQNPAPPNSAQPNSVAVPPIDPDAGQKIENAVERVRRIVAARDAGKVDEEDAAQVEPAGIATQTDEVEAAERVSSEIASSVSSKALTSGAYKVGKGGLPSSTEYWNFLNWYKNHSVVSLVVSGKERKHLLDALTTLYLLREQNVLIGEVWIVGGAHLYEISSGGLPEMRQGANRAKAATGSPSMSADFQIKPTELSVLGKKLGLIDSQSANAQELLKRLGAKSSPVWVVRYHGKDLVYEGNIDPRRLFSRDGLYQGVEQ